MDEHPRRSVTVVLVVEDEPLIRFEACRAFGDHGWIVLEADTAGRALEILRSHPDIDVVFTDIDLRSSQTGWDVAEAARAARQEAAVIYTSGIGRDLSRKVKDSVFFAKPYSLDEIIETSSALAIGDSR